MRKVGVVVLVLILVLVGVALPSAADAWGFRGHGFQRDHFGGHRFHRFHHHRGAFFFGFGAGALLTAPLWYPPVYAYPSYTPPPVPPPPATYWYYCQNPPGYYPYVAACPSGWVPVVPPAGVP